MCVAGHPSVPGQAGRPCRVGDLDPRAPVCGAAESSSPGVEMERRNHGSLDSGEGCSVPRLGRRTPGATSPRRWMRGRGRSQGHPRGARLRGGGGTPPPHPSRRAPAPPAAPGSARLGSGAGSGAGSGSGSRSGSGAGGRGGRGARRARGQGLAPRAPATRSPVARRRPWGAGLRGPAAGRVRGCGRRCGRGPAGTGGLAAGSPPLTPPLSPPPTPCVPPPRPSSPAPPQLGPWSWRGCRTVPLDALRTRCLCDRLSTFAILAQLSADAVRPRPGRARGTRGARGGRFRRRTGAGGAGPTPARVGAPGRPRGLAAGRPLERMGGSWAGGSVELGTAPTPGTVHPPPPGTDG